MTDPTTPEAPPAAAASPARPPSWRKRHPILARSVLYGALVVVLAAGARAAQLYRANSLQQSLLVKVQGLHDTEAVFKAPEMTLRVLREEVLPEATDADVIRNARLTEAAALDGLERFDEAEKVYADLAATWPEDLLKGPVYVPWANLRIRAGRPGEALALLDVPGATSGWPAVGEAGADAVRARAKAALSGHAPSAAPVAPPPKAGGR